MHQRRVARSSIRSSLRRGCAASVVHPENVIRQRSGGLLSPIGRIRSSRGRLRVRSRNHFSGRKPSFRRCAHTMRAIQPKMRPRHAETAPGGHTDDGGRRPAESRQLGRGRALIRRCSGGLRGPFGDDLAVTRKTLGRTVSSEVLVATARGHNGLTGYLVETAGRETVLEHWHGATP